MHVGMYSATWDVNVVISYLSSIPLENVSIKMLSLKLSILLALLSGQRLQTLQSFKVCYVCINVDLSVCSIYIDGLLKTTFEFQKFVQTPNVVCMNNKDNTLL